MLRKLVGSVGVAASLLAGGVAVMSATTPAGAQPFERRQYEEWQYETKRPKRGYEGFPAPGVYCSYRREPVRTCTHDKRGRERCRVTSWRLVQWCS
jgi:hypothetical protein